MPEVTYVTPDGATHVVDIPVGQSVMEGSIRNNLPGILADCGGNVSCATCHVYLEAKYWDVFAEPSEDERDMLEFAEDVTDQSRLSCQLVVSPSCAGAIVTVARRD